jgi:hypothetical protein
MDKEIINKISIERERYINYFEKTINSLLKDKDNFAIELPVQTKPDTTLSPFNIIRVDFITKDQNDEYSISELRLDKILDYPSKTFLYNNLQITISPFCWNSCEFLIDKVEIHALKEWVYKWLNIDDEIENETYSNAIHSCTEPEKIDNKLFLTIDFGTANEIAFTDLIKVLSNNGATEMNIQTLEI